MIDNIPGQTMEDGSPEISAFNGGDSSLDQSYVDLTSQHTPVMDGGVIEEPTLTQGTVKPEAQEEGDALEMFLEQLPDAFEKIVDEESGEELYITGFAMMQWKVPSFNIPAKFAERYKKLVQEAKGLNYMLGFLVPKKDVSEAPTFSRHGIETDGNPSGRDRKVNARPFNSFTEKEKEYIVDTLILFDDMAKEQKQGSSFENIIRRRKGESPS